MEALDMEQGKKDLPVEKEMSQEAWNGFLDMLERHTGHKFQDRSIPEVTPEEREAMRELQEKWAKLSKEDIHAMLDKMRQEEDDYY